MNSKIYWEKRRAAVYDLSLEELRKALISIYKRAAESAVKDASLLLFDIETVNDLYRFNRYNKLLEIFNKQLKLMGESEIKVYNKSFYDLYEATNTLLVDADNTFTIVDKTRIDAAINAIWCADGIHWSKRVWKNNELLQKRLEKGLIDCVSRGVPKDELIKDLKNTFGIGFRRAETVARTELSYIQNQATLDTYKQSNIKQYQFLGAGGNCDICAQLNGNIYNISDAVVGVNMPPIHPNCRCGILAVI